MFRKGWFSLIHSSRTGLIVVVTGFALLAAACGGAVAAPTTAVAANPPASQATKAPAVALATATSSAAKPSDACVLLPKDEVSKVLGEAVTDATSKGLGGVCSYKTASLSFELTVFKSGGTQYLQQTKAKLGALALVVAGLGDEAFYNTNSFINTLFLRKGDAAYLVDVKADASVKMLTPEEVQAKEKALAVQLLTHLP